MSNPVISVRGLGKKYKLGATLSHDTFRDHLTYGVKSLWHRIRRNSQRSLAFDRESLSNKEGKALVTNNEQRITNNDSEIWALKDINFDVNQGEVIGIIGRNGAGKSTLLKVLSQITEPTEGEAHIRGRIASLLEVGTGFHPELTGRENIYLNGAILGMTRAEIKSKFDAIVAFAELEKFIDTPVKRYSSGMYVRLAFAVAAHLEPEILLVDEVLAVGDAEFQTKCLGKMGEVAKEGRTILFVSHNMQAVQSLCGTALQFEAGKIVALADSRTVVSHYLTGVGDKSSEISWQEDSAPGNDEIKLTAVRVFADGEDSSGVFPSSALHWLRPDQLPG
jgi:lipopolysaccharide transport system ATP-binding protein